MNTQRHIPTADTHCGPFLESREWSLFSERSVYSILALETIALDLPQHVQAFKKGPSEYRECKQSLASKSQSVSLRHIQGSLIMVGETRVFDGRDTLSSLGPRAKSSAAAKGGGAFCHRTIDTSTLLRSRHLRIGKNALAALSSS